MFISVLELFKVGIGPSSSHTVGPMIAAGAFLEKLNETIEPRSTNLLLHCTLKGSLAYTGKGHSTDKAIILGLNGYEPQSLSGIELSPLVKSLWQHSSITLSNDTVITFSPATDLIFDRGDALPQHPNGIIFELKDDKGTTCLTETYFSIGGGFIKTLAEIDDTVAPLDMRECDTACPFPFASAGSMMKMAQQTGKTIAQMKRSNELKYISEEELNTGLDGIWEAMKQCVDAGLANTGILPGSIAISRRAHELHQQLLANPDQADKSEWLCAYAMAVNEENADGHQVVTAPTNGAAGVLPAVLYHYVQTEKLSQEQIRDFLLTAAAICGLIKHKSSISGAEVGCQGEVGSASSMTAAAICALQGGTPEQVENAAEIALEHHLGLTCDPVAGLVQVPCIERNGFGAIKACTAASLALRGSGKHFMSLDSCIAAMKETGMEMSVKYKETALGGLAVSFIEC